MFVRLQNSYFLIILCIIFLVFSFKFFSSISFSSIFGSSQTRMIQDIWDYKLNLTAMFVPITDKERNLFAKLRSIQASCGEVCDTSISSGIMGKYYEQIHKNIDCEGLFTNPDMDALSEYEIPPKTIPNYLLPEFTHGGKLEVVQDWRDETKGIHHKLLWTKEDIETQMKQFEAGELQGHYGLGSVQIIAWHLDNIVKIKDQTVLVIGSQAPWLEAILLSKGAKHVTTFDYIQITSEHPQIETITPVGLAKKYFDGILYDLVVTYSSIEHSGLGRYGDMLNPWGDLIAMARSWCLVKPGGYGLVGVPTGPDRIGFNSHKVYGPLAYAQIFSNWEQLYTETDFSKYDANGSWWAYQPVHSLRRI